MVPAATMRAYVTQVAVTQKENARQHMVATARAEEARVLREQTARSGGIAPTLTRIVDGKRGAAYEAVGDKGLIILEWKYLREIAAVAMRKLKARAPEQRGDYKRGLKVFAGNAEATLSAAGIPLGVQRITVVATVPYSRRLEVGKSKDGSPFVVQVPPHMVAETAAFLAKDYAGVARIRFTYEDVEGPGGTRSRPSTGNRRADRKRDVALRYPAIQVVDPR
jgi:hypothetical protein